MEMTAAEAFCQALADEGVDTLFGHPGGAILPFYDALYRSGHLRHVLMRHEQAAAHAADGYARATGRVGVCVATSGPGATNLVTGLAAALMDSVPVVAITGQVPLAVMGTEAFQETDILGVTMPVTKHGYLIDNPHDVPRVVREAFRLARSGRPGPVLIDIPKDVQNALCARAPADAETGAAPIRGRAAATPPVGGSEPEAPDAGRALECAARLLATAKRPLVMAGRGVVIAGATRLLRELAERADLPVVPTLLGLDAMPASHPLCLGMPGMHGTERANRAIQRADVILGLGLRFDDRVTGATERFAPEAAIIHLDIDPVSIGRTVHPAVRIVGDLRATLPALDARVAPARRPEWWTEIRRWRREAASVDELEEGPGPLSGRRAARELARRIARDGAIVATDVGQHQMWIAQELGDAAPGTHLSSGGLGAMGYALPAAIGAAVGRPDRPVWAIAGDGGFQMTLQELATVVQERLPIRIAVVNNGFLGMVRQWQQLYYQRRYSASELSGPDLIRLAEAYGIPGVAVDRADALEAALEQAADAAGPVLVELRVPAEENVYPIVPPGAALHELVTAPRQEVAA